MGSKLATSGLGNMHQQTGEWFLNSPEQPRRHPRAERGPGTFRLLACGVMTGDSLSFTAGINSRLTPTLIDAGFTACLRKNETAESQARALITQPSPRRRPCRRRCDSGKLASLYLFILGGVKMLKRGT